jgi:nicotinate-nucleotide adenylyltransferase
MAKERIGILGGTFDPIHEGHIHMALSAMQGAHLDRVLVLPTGNPPHKIGITPAEDRWRMVCCACALHDGLTPCRAEIDREGVIYTVDTLSILHQDYPKAELFYLIGTDTLMELHTWRNFEQVLSLCTFVICPRPTSVSPKVLADEQRRLIALGGRFVALDADVVDVSSTELRQALAGIADAGGEGLLHKGVHILGIGVDGQRTAGQIIGDGSQTVEDVLTVLFRDDALLCQHGGVHAAAAHILRDHALIEPDGGVEVVHAGIHGLGKTALPELFCHSFILY